MVPKSDQCSKEGCTRKSKARGLCAAHYEAARRGARIAGTPKEKRRSATWIHTLSDLDAEKLTATCANCGPTEVYYRADRNIYACLAAKRQTQADYILRRTYGIGFERKRELWNSQERRCPICTEHIDLFEAHIDHDHDSYVVRALLCGPCNKAIGLLKDSSDVALAAAKYLIHHGK